jgi:hypothetical protein
VLDLLDLAHADAGHAHVVAVLEHRGVGEHRLVLGGVPEAEVAHDHREQPRDQQRDDREDQQLDAGGHGLGVAPVAQPGRRAAIGPLAPAGGGLLLRHGGHEPSPPRTTGP